MQLKKTCKLSSVSRSGGIAMIYVLVIITGFTLFMINQASSNQQKYQALALEYSLSQTHSVMNLVYAYYRTKGEWPVSGRHCLVPSQFLDLEQGMNNGWGHALEGGKECEKDGDDYILVQKVPEEYTDQFKLKFEEVEMGLALDGKVELEIALSTHAEADYKIDSKEIASPMRTDVMKCGSRYGDGYAHFVSGICSDPPAASANLPIAGFRLESEKRDYLTTWVPPRKRFERKLTTDVYQTDVASSNYELARIWSNSENDNQNAKDRCPSGGDRIPAVTVTWCD